MTEYNVGKIADFGLSKQARRSLSRNIKAGGAGGRGTGRQGPLRSLLWAAPEVLRGERSSREADVYAFGIVLWEVVHWSEPFPGISPTNVAMWVLGKLPPQSKCVGVLGKDDNSAAHHLARPTVDPHVERSVPGIGALLGAAWHEDDAARPTFLELLEALQRMLERATSDTSRPVHAESQEAERGNGKGPAAKAAKAAKAMMLGDDGCLYSPLQSTRSLRS